MIVMLIVLVLAVVAFFVEGPRMDPLTVGGCLLVSLLILAGPSALYGGGVLFWVPDGSVFRILWSGSSTPRSRITGSRG